jgi:signal transduction histidine kinase
MKTSTVKKTVLKNTGSSNNNGITQETSELHCLIQLNEEVEHTLQFGTFEYDFVSGIDMWSAGMYEILQRSRQEGPLTYNAFISCLVMEDFDNIPDNVKNSIFSREEYNDEYEIRTANNIIRHVQLIGKRTINNKGEIIKDAGILKDITTQKEREEIVNKVINELIRSNKELEGFAYIASHDLQEPVRKITTFIDRLVSLISEKLSDEERLYLKRIMSSAESMRSLIDNLLEYSRLSRNEKLYTDINLNFILKQVTADLELIIEETGTTIVSQKLPTIKGSAQLIKQLFTNIISNSIKFRKPGASVKIHIENSLLPDDERERYKLHKGLNYYKIEIIDDGIGFEQEYASRIFQIFQRLHGKSEYPGSGIGLAICKKIVEQHHGIIYARGQLGIGSKFVIIFPETQP